MDYSDFSVSDLRKNFDITFKAVHLFSNITPIPPTNWLTTTLKKGIDAGFSNEKSRSERLVTPILLELSDRNKHSFRSYLGYYNSF